MKQPVLVVMAAGMWSRYGGLKQIDPIDEYGNIIMDFSIYDAIQAGFRKVVFIIKKENEESFRAAIGDRIAKQIETAYVFQDLNNIPEGFKVPQDRVKPWGQVMPYLAVLVQWTARLLLLTRTTITEAKPLSSRMISLRMQRKMISSTSI